MAVNSISTIQGAKLSRSFKRLDSGSLRQSIRFERRASMENDSASLNRLRSMCDLETKPEGVSLKIRILQWAGICAMLAISTSLLMR